MCIPLCERCFDSVLDFSGLSRSELSIGRRRVSRLFRHGTDCTLDDFFVRTLASYSIVPRLNVRLPGAVNDNDLPVLRPRRFGLRFFLASSGGITPPLAGVFPLGHAYILGIPLGVPPRPTTVLVDVPTPDLRGTRARQGGSRAAGRILVVVRYRLELRLAGPATMRRQRRGLQLAIFRIERRVATEIRGRSSRRRGSVTEDTVSRGLLVRIVPHL